jgi:hypothetical protein
MAVTSESTRPSEQTYQAVSCPGLPAEACQALNEWGAAWENWGNAVMAWANNIGGWAATNVSPPLPPGPKFPQVVPGQPFN